MMRPFGELVKRKSPGGYSARQGGASSCLVICLCYNYFMPEIGKKRGRPIGSTAKAKGALMQFRADSLEKQAFYEAAALSGLTVSAWIRERLRRICQGELQAARRPVPFLDSRQGF